MIDGSVNPELISDQEAITVFWISIMEQPSAGAPEKNRFAAKTYGMHLSAPDAALLWNAALKFNNLFAPYLAQAQQLASAATAPGVAPELSATIAQQRAATAAAVDQLAMNTYNGLLSSFSAADTAALKNRIAELKTHMKIIPQPKM